ncbi:hypothetical protein [Methylomonas sp. UP202]|uniref:hypothetical protein n=1 Tax=Methylomonas sp. UP202 TaxID=3040943 RepID=UPI0024795E69|nr:hypothetical protein [Methylomonas sp. UP202]WGS87546.1 hypothetical protein QC632_07250 [Methylomonas sp. UP202]
MIISKPFKPTVCLAGAISMALGTAHAAPPMPNTMEEMWKIVQQQQQEIEALKAKTAQNEALQQEVNTLKEQQKSTQAVAQSTPVVNGKTGQNGELERKTDVLATEVERLKTQLFIPESREYKSQYGLGPAASNVYRVNRGISIGGYGEAMYTNYADPRGDSATNKDTADLERAVIYLGYKFNDWIVLNNEIEFEHASTGEGDESKGEVSVEFSQLDFLLNPKYNVRAGLMLMPMGFINEMHEPTTYHGNHRPDVERYIIPSTWREMGAGLFGEILPGLQYRMYAVNGLNASSFSNIGITEGRQGGSNAQAEDFAFTGRLDYSPSFVPGLMVGGSTFLGNSSQKNIVNANGSGVDLFTQLHEGHIQYKYRGLELRALGAWSKIDNTEYLNPLLGADGPIGKESFGWYVEAAHDIMPFVWKESSQYLAPFVRVERYDTVAAVASGFEKGSGLDRWIYQAGLSYKPIENVVIKADYRNIRDRKLVPAGVPFGDEFNLGFGFIY